MKILYNFLTSSKSGVEKEKLHIFEDIMSRYDRQESENRFMSALGEHLTDEQRILLFEKHGACKGTGYDKNRSAYANEHKNESLAQRVQHYVNNHVVPVESKLKNVVLDVANNTITVTFLCDECYCHVQSGKFTAPFEIYYERCAGGRMYTMEKILNVKLKIKSMEIPHDGVKVGSPCVYVYDIIDVL